MGQQPYDYCECGCGKRTALAKNTDARTGNVAGTPRRFVAGHQSHPLGPDAWVSVDTGYTTPCWLWQRGISKVGYACRSTKEHPSRLVHRQHFEAEYGPIAEGLEIDHLCRVRHCVNPAHLEPVTRRENSRRGAKPKLTVEQAREIRDADETYVSLAERFGVATSTVWNIRTGRQWRGI